MFAPRRATKHIISSFALVTVRRPCRFFFAERCVEVDGDKNCFFHASDSSRMGHGHGVPHCDDRSVKPLFLALLSVALFCHCQRSRSS